MSSFRECCTAKYPLRPNDSAAYLVRRSNAAPGRAVCFLGRFLPKLGGAASTATFLLSAGPEAASGLNIARSMSSPWRLRVSRAMAKRSPHSALTPAVLRAQAERIRTYAYSFSDGKLVDRLQKYADELDARAKALEEESSEM
jgi:hypothetical protein